MTPKLSEILEAANCSRDSFNNWKRRGIFLSGLPDSSAGVAQELSIENALEVAFIAAICAVGYEPAAAAIEARRWFLDHRKGKLLPLWAANPQSKRAKSPGSIQLGISLPEKQHATYSSLSVMLPDSVEAGWVGDGKSRASMQKATTIVIVNREEIVSRVLALYTESK